MIPVGSRRFGKVPVLNSCVPRPRSYRLLVLHPNHTFCMSFSNDEMMPQVLPFDHNTNIHTYIGSTLDVLSCFKPPQQTAGIVMPLQP